jgi:hypothetical protein
MACIFNTGWAVGMATRYRLDGPGIESQLGQDFLNLSRPTLVLIQRLVQWVRGPGLGVYHRAPSSAVVKERVELYLYSPSV